MHHLDDTTNLDPRLLSLLEKIRDHLLTPIPDPFAQIPDHLKTLSLHHQVDSWALGHILEKRLQQIQRLQELQREEKEWRATRT